MTFPGPPWADLAKTRAGLRQSTLQLPGPRACQVAQTLALYGQNCPAKPDFGVSFISIFGPRGSVGLSSELSLAQTSARPTRVLEAPLGARAGGERLA